MAVSGTLSFALGELSKTFAVPILNDGLAEDLGDVVLTLRKPASPSLGPIATATLTIVDNDLPIRFAATEFSASEAASVATITVLRGDDGPSSVTVQYGTEDGTAVAGQDYTATSGSLAFAGDEFSKSFSVQILNDGLLRGGFQDGDPSPGGPREHTIHIVAPLDEPADGVPENLRHFLLDGFNRGPQPGRSGARPPAGTAARCAPRPDPRRSHRGCTSM